MGKVLLIQPAFEFNKNNKDNASMPLGLIYMGTVLKEKNHQVKILDRNINNSDEYLKNLLSEAYDFVGIGTFTGPMLFDAIHVSKITKKNSNSKVIWGSFHPTIMPEQTLENEYVDHIIRGEGENVFLEMVELNDLGENYSKLRGLDLNPLADPVDINKLPFPDYDLINVKDYSEFFILTSRGCPFRCTFCYNSYGEKSIKPYRFLSAEKTIELITRLTSKYKIKTFTIPDDNFAADKERLKTVCNSIAKLKLKFYCLIRANNCDIETLSYLKNAGAWNVCIGFESGSQKILNFMKKGTTVEMNATAIKNIKKIGILSEGSFMIGLPTETIEDIELTFKFIKENKCDNGGVKIFQPFPKTKLWDYCIEKNLIKEIPKTTEEWASRYVAGFDKVVLNVSEVPDKTLEEYYGLVEIELKKGSYSKKIVSYIKNGRLPNYKKIKQLVKRYIK